MNKDQQELETMILKLQQDKEILGEVYDRTYQAVYVYILGIIKNQENAKDVTHDVYLNIYRYCKRYQAMGQPMAWIYKIAKNTALMYFRKNDKEVQVEENVEVAVHGEDMHSKIMVETLLNDLTDIEQQIISLHIFGGLTFKEVAAHLEMKLPTVLSKYHRAVKKMKEKVKEV